MIELDQEITAGNTLIREAIQSQNYVAGSTGWRIAANGDAELNNVTVRGKLITGPTGTKHIEVNGVDAPNGIAFYTGDAAELFPSVIQPWTEANDLGILLSSGQTAADTVGSSLKLYTHKFASSNSEAVLTSQGFVGLATKTELQLTNVTTGTTLDFNTVGGDNLNSTKFNISDPSLTGNTGVSVTGGYVQPLNLNTWQSITNLAAMSGGTGFVNGWTDVAGARFQAYKDATGIVYIRGETISGTAGQVMTMPTGWRPTQSMEWCMRAQGGVVLCAVFVSTTGAMTVTANLATAESSGVRLDSISYPTA